MDRLFLFLIIGALVVLVTALLLALGNPVFSFNGCLAPAGGPSVSSLVRYLDHRPDLNIGDSNGLRLLSVAARTLL
jgi:hypothetical protein